MVEGAPFSYLGIVRDDHLGAGSLSESFASPLSWAIPLQAVVGAGAALAATLFAARRGAPLSGLLWEAHALLAVVLLAGLVISGEVPSQFPERMLLWIIAFSAVPVGRLAAGLIGHGARRCVVVGACCGGLLLASGGAYALRLPLGIPRGDFEAGLLLRESFEKRHLTEDDHVVIEHALPESTALFVYSNRPVNVHIDALGTICPARLLSPVPSICPVPTWASDVRLVLAREPGTVDALRSAGWSVRSRVGEWTFVVPGPGARPLPLADPIVIDGVGAR